MHTAQESLLRAIFCAEAGAARTFVTFFQKWFPRRSQLTAKAHESGDRDLRTV